MLQSFATSPPRGDEPFAQASRSSPLLRPGETCWRIERAHRLTFLIDGEAYFAAVRAALTQARQSIFILGWDIDSRMCLMPRGARDGYPEPLGEFINAVLRERHGLHAYILAWDYAMLYALEREWLPVYQFGWKGSKRLAFKFDDQHPLGACHHQKLVVVDDRIAFIGGFDLTRNRWDTPQHAENDPGRVTPGGDPYAPFHDVGAVVDADCARALGELARTRWKRATGHEPVQSSDAPGDHWPDVEPSLTDVDVAIARTEPGSKSLPGVEEIRQLQVEAISTARRWIFAENQYFTSRAIADAWAQRLSQPTGPEIALISPAIQSGWLESSTMGVLRARLHKMLRAVDVRQRYRLYCPTLPWRTDAVCLNVHSKLMIVDDELLTLGSANLSDRSMRLDTECNIALEARGDTRVRSAIASLRERLLAEHLGVEPREVATAIAREGSLHRAIASLNGRDGRTLAATEPGLDPTIDAMVPDHGVLDPERPLDPDVIVGDLLPAPHRRSGLRHRMIGVVLLVVALACLALAWRYTPLAQWIDFDKMVGYADSLSDSPLAPVAVVLAYVVGGLLVVPVTMLIGVTAIVFGPALGSLYAIVGALTSGVVTYALGRKLGRDTVRRLAGRRLNDLSRRLGRRGLLAVVIVRLLPIAPYSVINVVAGASHIGWRDFLLGTTIGLTPGIVMTSLFVDRAVAAIRHPGPVTFAILAAVAATLVAIGWAIRRSIGAPPSRTSSTDERSRIVRAS